MKRPLSVWTVLVVLSLVCLIMLPAIFTFMIYGFSRLWGSSLPPMQVVLFYLEFAIKVGLVGFFIWTVIEIARGIPRGRWMGLIALAILFAGLLYNVFNPTPAGQGLPKFDIKPGAEAVGAEFGKILVFVGLAVLFYRFGFSERSREFFSVAKTPKQGTKS